MADAEVQVQAAQTAVDDAGHPNKEAEPVPDSNATQTTEASQVNITAVPETAAASEGVETTCDASQGAKRTHDDVQEGSSEQEVKRANTGQSDEAASTTQEQTEGEGTNEYSRVIQVPSSLAGYIIGTRGETIRRLEASSGARIRLAQDGIERDVTITGSEEAVNTAVQLVEEVVKAERERFKARNPAADDGTDIPDRIEFLCPCSRVGLIIGRGGEKIKTLEEKSGARIQVVQDGLPPYAEGKPVILTGTREAVEEAQRQILGVIGDGFIMTSNYSLTVFNNPDGSVDMEVAAGVVGLVIGRQGDTIRSIQSETGTVVEMERDSGEPMRKMKVTGSRECVHKAFRKIMSIIEEARRRDEAAGRGFGANVALAAESHAFPISSKVVGLVIGRGGETIHQIQDKTGAKVQLEHNAPPGAPEKVFTITGTIDQVEAAKLMIWEKVGEGPMPMSYPTGAGQGYGQQPPPYMYGGPGPYGYQQQGYAAPVQAGGGYSQGGYGMTQPQGGQWGGQGYSQNYWPQTSAPAQQPEGDGSGSQWGGAWQQYYGGSTSQSAQVPPAQYAGQGQSGDYSQQWANYYPNNQQPAQQATAPQGGQTQWTNDQWQQYYAAQGQPTPR